VTATDWFLLAVLVASLLLGAWRGLVFELMSMLGWVAAFVLAQWWAPELAPRLPMGGASEPVRFAAAFALLFVAVAFGGGLVATVTRKLVESVGLRPVDRTLGAAFGIVRGLVLLLALAVVINMTPERSSPWWQTSTGASLLSTALKGLRPVLPEVFGSYLPA
jgi:membrane protein required for colicin V production